MDAYIYEAIRTPRGAGTDRGALHNVTPIELLGTLYQALVERTGLDPAQVDDVLIGCNTAVRDQGANIAKISTLMAGWPDTVPGATINRFCASGFDAINQAAASIHAGMSDLVLAGGVESMSRVPMLADKGAWFADPQVAQRTGFVHMAVAADAVATQYGFDRAACDDAAVSSHQRAANAWAEGRFDRAVVPVADASGASLTQDETIRPTVSADRLAALPPVVETLGLSDFDRVVTARHPRIDPVQHVHTVASAPGMVDAASVLLIGSEQAGQRWGLTPLARVLSYANVSVDPVLMLTGPARAARAAIAKAGLAEADIDLYECNESFAATVLAFMADMGIGSEMVNINGGAIAMGHPLGATGGILTTTLIDALTGSGGRYGVATIPAGAGLATATVLEVL